ncbi:MAG: DUF503 domain-containing protein [Deltaproteobacteria bacterium]|nr:DUF503 domain-containing protein [Candidatus Anaeroferrophillus wilburensis]MBN2888921.1 DUF503 domain-containing protein [Deltaproteobacteria bacterium]
MHVGVCQVELFLPENRSLKGKRRVLKSLIQRIRNTFNVSVAETGGHDDWQRSVLALTIVSKDQAYVNRGLDKILDFIEDAGTVVVGDSSLEIVSFHDC